MHECHSTRDLGVPVNYSSIYYKVKELEFGVPLAEVPYLNLYVDSESAIIIKVFFILSKLFIDYYVILFYLHK
jgi:hypothetical protein